MTEASLLDQIIKQYLGSTPDQKAALRDLGKAGTQGKIWVPNPGPQEEAYLTLADELGYGGEAGGGKDLDIHELLATPAGWTTMGEVQVGEQVLDERGLPCNVIAKSCIFNRPAYKLTFSDGSTIVAGPNHEWVTSTYQERIRALKCADN
jgi:hypothetical protein